MSWQEELRRLDAELAQGRLSKLQYSAQREELLAKASSEPEGKPSGRRPHPTKTPAKPDSRISAADLLTTGRPTSAPSPADECSTDSFPHPPKPPEPSTPRPNPAPARVPAPPRVAPLAQRLAHMRDEPATRPLPPVPDVPVGEKSRGRVRTWVLVALGVLIVLGLIAGSLWWMNRDGGGSSAAPAGNETSTTVPTTTSTPELFDRLPELPGVLNQDSGTFTVDEGIDRKLYGADEAAVLKEQDVRKVTWKGSSRTSSSGNEAYVVLVAENESAAAAKSTEKALLRLARDRARRVKSFDRADSVPAFKLKAGKSTAYFVIYPSDRYTVLIISGQTPVHDDKEMWVTLADMLTDVTGTLAPD